MIVLDMAIIFNTGIIGWHNTESNQPEVWQGREALVIHRSVAKNKREAADDKNKGNESKVLKLKKLIAWQSIA